MHRMAAVTSSSDGRASSAGLPFWAREYLSALARLPQIAKRHCFRRRTLQEELNEVSRVLRLAPPETPWSGEDAPGHASLAKSPTLRRQEKGSHQPSCHVGPTSPQSCLPVCLSSRRCAPHPPSFAPPVQAMLRGSLRQAFGGFDILMLGCGIVIGSGWSQLMGMAALYAGWVARHSPCWESEACFIKRLAFTNQPVTVGSVGLH